MLLVFFNTNQVCKHFREAGTHEITFFLFMNFEVKSNSYLQSPCTICPVLGVHALLEREG